MDFFSDQMSFKFPEGQSDQNFSSFLESEFERADMGSSTPQKAPTQQKLVTFEYDVGPEFGTQSIEVYDRKNISNAVETFALKFKISDQKTITKLKKYVKKKYDEKRNVSFSC